MIKLTRIFLIVCGIGCSISTAFSSAYAANANELDGVLGCGSTQDQGAFSVHESKVFETDAGEVAVTAPEYLQLDEEATSKCKGMSLGVCRITPYTVESTATNHFSVRVIVSADYLCK